MFKKLSQMIATAIVVGALGFVGVGSSVALAAGTSPTDASAPAATWTAASVGHPTWYAFQYAGDGSQITIDMALDANNPTTFSVWTQDEIQMWQRDGTIDPVGRGSADPFAGGDLVWSGNFDQAGTYYVIVETTGSTNGTYKLNLQGSGVYFAAQQAAAIAAPTMATTAAAPAAMVKAGGTGPGDARAIPGKWLPLPAGQRVWYAFQYGGGDAQVTIRMSVDPNSPATFDVWTPAEVAQWAQDGTIDPVGSGSADPAVGGDLVWSGNFPDGGAYYITVETTGSTPSNYLLTIN